MRERHQKMEPTADQRALAKTVVGLHVALMAEGMSNDEALDFIARWLANQRSSEEDQ